MSRLSSSRRRPPASRRDLVSKKPARQDPVPEQRSAKKPAHKKPLQKESVLRKPAPAKSTFKKSVPQTPRQRELTTKRRGELAELAFVLKAASLGFGVSRPFGDSERYDAILDARDLRSRRPRAAHVWTAAPGRPAAQNHRAASGLRRTDARDLRSRAPHVGTAAPGCPAAQQYRAAAGPTRSIGKALPTPPDPSPHLWRVQIKCSTQLTEGLYRVNAHRRANGRAVPYLPGEIHFFAAYIIPEDTWYILPLAAIQGRTSLLFRRRRDPKPGLYDLYREAWHLLRPKP